MRSRQLLWFVVLTGAIVATTTALSAFARSVSAGQGPAQAARTVQDGVYTDGQAARGQQIYTQGCAGCHGGTLQGSGGPPLAGAAFVAKWQGDPVAVLVSKIKNTMPADGPGTLTDAQTNDLVAYMLKTSGFPAGRTELTGDLTRLTWPRATAVAAQARPAGGNGALRPPVGNLASLMRGVFFPNSNLIFAVQQQDPGAPKPANPAAGAPANYFDWGQGIYTGWQVVDNAALAIVDISPMMLNPDLKCENGRPAPVTDPDWIKYTEQLITITTDLYKKSQSRNQEAVSDATGDFSDACFACHAAYRDVRAPGAGRAAGPGDPQANAGRCQSRVK